MADEKKVACGMIMIVFTAACEHVWWELEEGSE